MILYVGHKTMRFSFQAPKDSADASCQLVAQVFLQLHFYTGRVCVLVDLCVAASKLFFMCAIVAI